MLFSHSYWRLFCSVFGPSVYRLGHGDIIEEEGRVPPFRVEILHMHGIQVLAVDCGCEHTLALCQDGVYAWGASGFGQLGLGDRSRRTRPSAITELSDKRIMSIACGQYHCLALSRDHHVYSWGWGVHGQLGQSSCEDSVVPVRIAKLDHYRIKSIAAGYGHSAVLSQDGVMLTFGNSQYGQLGLGDNQKQSTPRPVEALEREKVSHIACGNFFTVRVLSCFLIIPCVRNDVFACIRAAFWDGVNVTFSGVLYPGQVVFRWPSLFGSVSLGPVNFVFLRNVLLFYSLPWFLCRTLSLIHIHKYSCDCVCLCPHSSPAGGHH